MLDKKFTYHVVAEVNGEEIVYDVTTEVNLTEKQAEQIAHILHPRASMIKVNTLMCEY